MLAEHQRPEASGSDKLIEHKIMSTIEIVICLSNLQNLARMKVISPFSSIILIVGPVDFLYFSTVAAEFWVLDINGSLDQSSCYRGPIIPDENTDLFLPVTGK